MPALKKTMFREYDIRGRVSDDELNAKSAEWIGRGFGTVLARRGVEDTVVGYDSRFGSVEIKDGLVKVLEENVGKENYDPNRLEQELIYYIEKIDLTEEQVRLKNHCDYFVSILEEQDENKGKKLSFILQEIGREINTTGAKAYDSSIQKCVVLMKDEMEKAKEQVLNVL